MTDHKNAKKKLSLEILFNKNVWIVLFLATYGLFWFRLPDEVPLYYSQALREDRLANKFALLLLPAVVYATFFVSERFLNRLALKNQVVLMLIKYADVVLAAFTYVLFLKILLLVA